MILIISEFESTINEQRLICKDEIKFLKIYENNIKKFYNISWNKTKDRVQYPLKRG